MKKKNQPGGDSVILPQKIDGIPVEYELRETGDPELEGLELTEKNVVRFIECGLNSLWFTGSMKVEVTAVKVDTRIGGKTVVEFREQSE